MASAVSIKLVSRTEWDKLSPLFRDLSYRQCGSYAEAAAHDVGAASEFNAFFRAEELVALANVRVKRVPFSPFGIAYSHYGPITALRDEFSAELFGCCLDALKKTYVEDRRLTLRIVPPLGGGKWLKAQEECFETRDFQLLASHRPHETFVLELTRPLDDIRKGLDGKWRTDLSKAQRSNIDVTRSTAPADFDRFEPMFTSLVQEKGFATRQDVAFFRRVQEKALAADQLVVHLAWHSGELIAGHIGSFVGDTAVYLLGASTAKGRELRASYLLQWAVIEYAKRIGNLFYDLGGIDQQANPNVYLFKKRLNGQRLTEIGPYELAPSRLAGSLLHFLEYSYNIVRRRAAAPG
jgi:lipid II:glycine glycyltransferase (peptidoglycan interpeptide bridge formation enzyme)